MEENYAVCDEVLGDVRISDEVVANIAVIAAGEIEGVSYVVGGPKPNKPGNANNDLKNIVGIKNHSKDLHEALPPSLCGFARPSTFAAAATNLFAARMAFSRDASAAAFSPPTQ